MIQQLASKEGCPRCGKNDLVTDNESGAPQYSDEQNDASETEE